VPSDSPSPDPIVAPAPGPDAPPARPLRDPGDLRRLVRQMLIGLAVMMVVAGLSAWFLQAPLQAAGEWSMRTFGLTGLFVGTIITDSSPLPLTNEPLMFLAMTGGVNHWTIFWVVSAASVLGGAHGYFWGWLLGRRTRIRERMHAWSPEVVDWLERNGGWGVAVAALTPIPYSLSTWTAGIVGTPLRIVMAAALLRIPKTGFYLLILILGWEGGTQLSS
jgi:membrane protein YqaA with SNARE-associated domain